MGFRYFSFEGRASLGEYWSYQIVFLILSGVFYLVVTAATSGPVLIGASILWLLSWPPMIAVGVRRMHDMGRSGGWLWVDQNNMAGWEKGDPSINEYGPPPQDEEEGISEGNPEREAILREMAERSR